MNKNIFLLLLFAISVFCQVANTCRKDAIDTNFAALNAAINRMDNIFDEGAPLGLIQPLQNLQQNALMPCINLVGAFVGTTVKENVTFSTRECPLPANDPARTNDPCCNFKTRFSKCCVSRDVTVPRDFIRTFNNVPLNANCKSPAKIKAIVRHFQRNYDARDGFCDILQAKRLAAVFTMQQKMTDCLNEYLNPNKPCTANGDCVSGLCNTDTEQCVGGFLSSPPEPLAQCLFNAIPKFAIRAFAIYNNITTTDVAVSQVTTMIQNAVFKDSCINSFHIVEPAFATQQTCEAAKVCTDGTPTTCPSQSNFCGIFCSSVNNQCVFNVAAIDNQQLCNTIGQCTNKNQQTGADVMNDNFYTNKTECDKQKVCTIATCYPNCTEQKCLTLGRCVGFPSQPGNGACVLPFTIDEDGSAPSCAGNDKNVGVGCYRDTVATLQQCQTLGGAYYNYPANQAECENFAVCREVENNDALTLKNSAECAKCNGIIWKPFTWMPAKFRTRVFQQRTQWVPRSLVNTRKWTKTLDFTGFIQFVVAAIRAVSYPIIKSTLLCKIEPIYKSFSVLACDCGADKTTAVDCFANLGAGSGLQLPAVGLGSIRVFSGASQNFSLGDATISVGANSVSISSDNVNIVITKTDVIVSSQTDSTTRSTMQSTKTVPAVVNAAGATTGQLVGDGITLTQSFANDVNLCIKRNPDMAIQSSIYNTAAFATYSNNQYVVNSAVVTRADAVEVCANVKTANTYYPAYISLTPATSAKPNTSGKKNNAALMVVNMFAIVVALIALLF